MENRFREYEIIYILRNSVDNQQAKNVAQKVEDVIGQFEGKITKVDNWGRRKLAYPIEKQPRGLFVYVRFVSTGNAIAELERSLRLIDYVVRFQTVKLNDEVKLEELQVNEDDTKFLDVEDAQEVSEKTLEQRLGMAPKAPKQNVPPVDKGGEAGEEANSDSAQKEKASSEGESASAENEKKEAAKEKE